METQINEEQLYQKLVVIREKREQFLQAPELQPHDCEEHKELRVRHFGRGKHYVYQCQECGWQRGQSLKRDTALEINGGVEPKLFDDSIETERDKIRQKAHEKLQTTYSEERKLSNLLEQFEEEFGEEKVIKSLIAQTVERKKKLYSERKEKTDRFTSEKELQHWFTTHLQEDFHIYKEVPGVHLAENTNVRIDFILYPKEHLISEGFVEEPFGVEVKYFKQEEGFTHKTSRGIWQTISYNDCLFKIKDKEFKTKFCLLFSNLSFSSETALIKNLGYEWENDQIEWSGMIHVANHARVGTLSINGDKQGLTGW